ncbi:MAG TPA: tetratricopeptide repeat protein, partial [Caulobacterales bacterium]|nr:tetratricopeptide repeat protein [Caulobacterales bacterium]
MLPGSPGIGRPPQLQDYLKAIDAAVRAGDMRRAMAVSGEAADRGFEHPNIFILAAYHNLNLNQFNKALDYATRARDSAPRNVDALNALGVSLTKLDRTREAIPIFDAALRQAPGAFITHFNKAIALEQASELRRA